MGGMLWRLAGEADDGAFGKREKEWFGRRKSIIYEAKLRDAQIRRWIRENIMDLTS
jgi:hypothetical protein